MRWWSTASIPSDSATTRSRPSTRSAATPRRSARRCRSTGAPAITATRCGGCAAARRRSRCHSCSRASWATTISTRSRGCWRGGSGELDRRGRRRRGDLHLRGGRRRGQDLDVGGNRARRRSPRPQGGRADHRSGEAACECLGLERLGNEPRLVRAVEGEGELWAMMLDPKRTFDELVETYASDARTRDAVLTNRIYKELSSAVSGSQEYMAMEKLYELHMEERFDLLVLDTPPTR